MSDATPASMPWWDRHARTPFPPLVADDTCDVAVVGLGGSGLACIGELCARGARVIGLDAGVVAGGAAGRNGGFLLGGLADFHHDAVATLGRERAARVHRRTLAELDRIAAETPDAVRRVGSLRVAASNEERDDCARQLAAMRADGLAVEAYDGPEGQGLLFPADAAFDPVARCLTLADRCARAGARLHERSAVCDIAAEPGAVVVRTERGVVRAGSVVVAVDGGLSRLLPELAGAVRTARLQMLATAPTTEVTIPRPVYSRYGFDYWQQMPTGEILVGGGRDVGGDAEWTEEATPTDVVQRALDRILRETIGVRAPVTHRWAASVGYTEDGIPVAREVRQGVFAIGGYSGTGNVIGAMLGRAAAAAALGPGGALAEVLA